MYSLGNLSLHPLPRVRWPLLLGAVFEVAVHASGPRQGRIAEYRVHPILHEDREGETHLLPLREISPRLRRRSEQRLAMLFDGVSPGGAAP